MEPEATTWSHQHDSQLAHYWSTEEPGDFDHRLVATYWATEEEEEQAAAAWNVHGLAVDPTSGRHHHQLVEYHPASSATADPIAGKNSSSQEPLEVDLHNMVLKIQTNPIHVFEKVAWEYKLDVDMMKMKIHRYPPAIRSLGEAHTVPTTVSIGPYHHGRAHLAATERIKHVAAYHCIRESGRHVQDIYDAVVSAAADSRRLYDTTSSSAVAAIVADDGEFFPMMFFDACFLVQYLLTCTHSGMEHMDPSLRSFFDANDNDVFRDIMLLENQIPWRVLEALMAFRPVPIAEFVASLRGCLQDRKVQDDSDADHHHKRRHGIAALDAAGHSSSPPPHLLGLLRLHIVGRSAARPPALPETEAISFSVSTIELAEIGVTLAATKTTELIHMGLEKKGNLFAELSLAPLSLDDTRACLLLNMAAFELCATPSFHDADDEDSAVCSYLLLLGMIIERDDDVHELRRRRILQGGGGLTNAEALRFLTSLQGLRLGSRYVRTMEEIENYKVKRRTRTKLHAFVYRNMKAIVTVVSGVTAVVGIFGTLKSLKIIH
ncbi:unnamed protein product [Urochloa humidicola]